MSKHIDIDALPGLKRKDIQPCCRCGKGVAHDGNITFYRIRMERYALDARAINERAGLEQFFGGGGSGAVLAEVMGTNRDLAKRVADEEVMLMCEACASEQIRVAVILEERYTRRAAERQEPEEYLDDPADSIEESEA